jgi:outer membrane protein TolC
MTTTDPPQTVPASLPLASRGRLLQLGGAILIFTALAGAQEPEVLTLERAVELALANSRSLQRAQLDLERAEDQIDIARSKRLPRLQLDLLSAKLLTPVEFLFEQGAFGLYPGIGPIPAEDTVVETSSAVATTVRGSIAQPLSQLHQVGLGVRLSEVGRDLERQQQRSERLDLILQVQQLYFGLLQTNNALAAVDEQVAAYRELERLVGDYVAQQTALEGDRLQVAARRAAEELRQLTYRHDLVNLREQLNHLLGRELDAPIEPAAVPELPPEASDPAALVTRALQRNPQLQQARLQVQQADLDRRIQRAELIPDVSLSLNYYSFFKVELLPKNLAQLGLAVEWEPFDWGRKRDELSSKQHVLAQARLGAEEMENQIRIEVHQRLRKLEEARRQVEVSRLSEQASREELRVTTNRYREHAALLKDVLDDQAALANASAQVHQAVLGLWLAKADLDRSVGEEE